MPRRAALDQQRIRAAIHEPSTARPETVLQLQRLGGNRAVHQLLAERGIQARLTVGAADDAYEQEADRIATAVTARTTSPEPAEASGATSNATQPAGGRISSITPLAQRHTPDAKPGDYEEDPEEAAEGAMQRSSDGRRDGAFEAGAAIESTLDRRAGSGRPLDAAVQRDMEARFGAGFGGVRVHDDSVAAQLNRDVGATAFTRGKDIYFGAGQFEPGSPHGQRLLAHELTHVVQQGGGRPSTPVQRNIGRGETLPDLGEGTTERIRADLDRDPSAKVQAARIQLVKLEQALADNAALRRRLAPVAAADDVLGDVRAAFTAPMAAAKNVLRGQVLAAHAGANVDPGPPVIKLVEDVKDALRANFKGLDFQARRTVVDRLQNTMGTSIGILRERFQETRGDVQLGSAYLPDDARASFAAALKQLPIVRSLTGPGGARSGAAGGAQGGPGGAARVPQWRDGGKLAEKVAVKPSKGIPAWLSKRRERKQLDKFKAKVDAVDNWLRTLLEPAMLRRVPRPEVLMHTRGRMKVIGSARRFVFLADPSGYRPNYGDGKVNLPYNEVFALIAHEMGHAIEEFLPIKSWHDMNLLLERRHEEKVGPNNREARTGATMWTSGVVNFGPLTNEGRYAGKYVTGKYTSTAYSEGNAEVFSQAMEFLTKPRDALKLIEGDPQHAAIVLRSIRPAEYATLAALRPFDKYLPIKGGGG